MERPADGRPLRVCALHVDGHRHRAGRFRGGERRKEKRGECLRSKGSIGRRPWDGNCGGNCEAGEKAAARHRGRRPPRPGKAKRQRGPVAQPLPGRKLWGCGWWGKSPRAGGEPARGGRPQVDLARQLPGAVLDRVVVVARSMLIGNLHQIIGRVKAKSPPI